MTIEAGARRPFVAIAPGLRIARPEARHAAALFALVDADRERLRRWLPWVDSVRSVEDEAAALEAMVAANARGAGLSALLVDDGPSGDADQPVGGVALHHVDKHHLATSLGYWIASGWEGRGLVTAACAALVDYCVFDLGLHRIELRAEPGNARSLAVARRLGFRREGVLRDAQRVGARWTDLAVTSVLGPEWRARRPDPTLGAPPDH